MIDPKTEAGKELRQDVTGLPAIECAADFCEVDIPEPAQIIKGVLHRGSKLVFGGPSKAFKSWNLIDLCIAVSTGAGWIGWPTMDGTDMPGRALYINLELQPFAIQKRVKTLCETRGIDPPRTLDIWNLRGTGASMTQLLHALPDGATYDLIVPDPLYKLYGPTRKENDVSDMAALMSEIEEMADVTGAAVAAGAHFAKGLASAKEHLDRVSGSGVFARDPDTFVTATPHEEDGGFVIETTMRNFAPIEPFSVRWDFPQMVRAMDLDPKNLKGKGGRPAEFTDSDITAQLKPGMTTTQWAKACKAEVGMSERKFYQLLKNIRDDRVVNSGCGWTFNTDGSCSKKTE